MGYPNSLFNAIAKLNSGPLRSFAPSPHIVDPATYRIHFPLYSVLLRLLGLPHRKARLPVLVRLIVVRPELADLDFVQFVRVLDDDCHGPATVRAFRLLNTTSASVDSMVLSRVFIPCKVYAPIVVDDLPTVVRLATAIVFVVLSYGCLPAILVLPSPNYGTTSAYLYTIPSCRVAIGVQRT
jgi:hypothetical protein